MKIQYPEYELVLDKVEHYYNLPLINFSITITFWPFKYHSLSLNKHYNLTDLAQYLYLTTSLKTIRKHDPYSCTWLPPKYHLMAVSYPTYVPLNIAQIPSCFHFSNTHICEQVFLTPQNTKHTPESAIHYDIDTNLIKQLCNITNYPLLFPQTILLDSGSELHLANLLLPLTFFCIHEKQISMMTEAQAMIGT